MRIKEEQGQGTILWHLRIEYYFFDLDEITIRPCVLRDISRKCINWMQIREKNREI